MDRVTKVFSIEDKAQYDIVKPYRDILKGFGLIRRDEIKNEEIIDYQNGNKKALNKYGIFYHTATPGPTPSYPEYHQNMCDLISSSVFGFYIKQK